MAGNRQVFEQAMRQGTNFAWDKQWDKAAAEYQRAIAEMPNEASAYAALGQALVYSGRIEEALDVYQRAARLTPDDTLALARVAELQEKLGDLAGTVQTWLHTADIHLRQHAMDDAIQVWQHLVEIAPNAVAAHERLAKAYVGMNQTRKAVRHYLALAAIHQQRGEQERAAEVCQSALRLDPRNSDVLTALEMLQQGRSLSQLAQRKPQRTSPIVVEAVSEQRDGAASLVELARQKAVTELAGALLEDSSLEDVEVAGALLQGIDFYTRGDIEGAIAGLEKAIAAGSQHAAVQLLLGLLYQQTLRFEEAVERFQPAVDHPEFGLGANAALGECLRALGRLDEAAVHFLEVLRQLDLAVISPENADELQQAYGVMARRYATNEKPAPAATLINAIVEFVSGEQWQDRVSDTRRQLDRLGAGRVISLAEMLVLPNSGDVLASMVQAEEYMGQGMLRSASEEYLWAIGHAPDYLPLHLLLARLFMQGNQVSMAKDKLLFVADTYAARDEVDQARGLYEQVLRVAPMDLDVRHKLISLLEEYRLLQSALEHRLALADAYFELAQIEASQEQYNEALRLASGLRDSQLWTARILHRLGDIHLQRLDWRNAIEVYLRLKAAVPQDDRARQRLVELYLNLRRQAEALAELDELIGMYRAKGDLPRAVQVLEDLVEARPQELELRKRSAQLCVEIGNKEGAITHLDAMGELQLQMGHVQGAAATIRAIIALKPENIAAYRELLGQIT